MAESVGEKEFNQRIFTNLRGVEPGGVSPSLSWTSEPLEQPAMRPRMSEPLVRPAMRPEDFEENLKPVSHEYGFIALNTIPIVGTYLSWVPKKFIDLKLPEPEKLPDVLRPPEQQRLIDWDADDLQRLGLPADFLKGEPSPERTVAAAKGSFPIRICEH